MRISDIIAPNVIHGGMRMSIVKMVGGVAVVGVAVVVCLWPRKDGTVGSPEPLRPVRSAVAKSCDKMPDLTFAGIVQASATRTLAFKQSGRIQRIVVSKGQEVRKGDKLAWLDPLDFKSSLAKAEAVEKRDRLSYERKSDALRKKAISQEDVSQSEAQLRQSEAALDLAKRALEETVLYAPFDGTVAEVPATELDMVGPANHIVKMQDTSSVNIDVGVAEKYILRRKQFVDVDTDEGRTVSFDSLPGRSFRVSFKEFQASADQNNQTFIATYTMVAPKDLLLLPGMSATLTISGASYAKTGDESADAMMIIPESGIGAASDGSHFVWVLRQTPEKGVYEVNRRGVVVVRRTDEGTVVTGLKSDERIATAGVSILSEGRKVTLL